MEDRLTFAEGQEQGIKQMKDYCKVTYTRMECLLWCERVVKEAHKQRKNSAEATRAHIISYALRGFNRKTIASILDCSQRTISAALSGVTGDEIESLKTKYPEFFEEVDPYAYSIIAQVNYSFVKYYNYVLKESPFSL